MSNSIHRILALDIRRSRFGFVVVEPSRRIINYGVKLAGPHPKRSWIRNDLTELLKDFSPTTVLVKRLLDGDVRKPLLRIAREETRHARSSFLTVSTKVAKSAFAEHNTNKYQIASAVTGIFPELSARLPAKRKCWQAENYWMTVFDAAAIYIAYSQPAH
jgi:hypothetical protein